MKVLVVLRPYVFVGIRPTDDGTIDNSRNPQHYLTGPSICVNRHIDIARLLLARLLDGLLLACLLQEHHGNVLSGSMQNQV